MYLPHSIIEVNNAWKKGVKRFLFSSTALFLIGGISLFFSNSAVNPEKAPTIGSFLVTVPTMQWGFAVDTLQIRESAIKSGHSLSDILIESGLNHQQAHQLIENAGEVFDLFTLRAGKPLVKLSIDSTQATDYLVYEPSVYEYIVFELKDDFSAYKTEKEITTLTETAAGSIESSLWNAMIDNGYSFELAAKMEDALQWSIDFHHLQPNEEFKLVYEQDYIEGEAISVRSVKAAYYQTLDTSFYSFYFEGSEEETGYYDAEGKPMDAGFLKAPVKYSRISSYFNLNRYHPVLKYNRPHFGTDYAAPYGTPIVAVGNGVITRASYTGGNGNFVKIKHNETYETQYLHMQRFGPGIKPGVHVRQGQVIGYVGSTGLATGPHVCFRFWQNGKQVNHLKLQFPPADPLPDELLPAFYELRDHYMESLESAKVPQKKAKEETKTVTAENP